MYYSKILKIVYIGKTVTLNTISFSYSVETEIYSYLVNEFNQYSKENNLNITLKLNLLNSSNSTNHINDYGSLIGSLLKKETKRYDIYFYDIVYSQLFGPFFMDLKKWLPKELINEYDTRFFIPACIYKDKLVGLPVYSEYTILYSNEKLLNKYNKSIPKTWNELLTTAKYILEEEKKLNNTNIIGYNGLFHLYEYFNISKIINTFIIKDIIFIKGHEFGLSAMDDESALFIKFFYIPENNPTFKKSPLPGSKEGISGSTVWAYNIGVDNRVIGDKNENEIKIALSYLCSKELQRKLTKKKKLLSPILNLYNEEEVCNVVNCTLFKQIQPILRPSFLVDDYIKYALKFTEYIDEFLFGNETSINTLNKIKDLTKIYNISFNIKDTYLGILIISIISVFILFIILSIIYNLFEDSEENIHFISTKLWIMGMIGIIIILLVSFTEIGNITILKCHIRQIMISIGFSFIILPIIYILINEFPKEISIFRWISQHQWAFILFYISIDIILNILTIFSPYDINKKVNFNNQKFEICQMNITFGKINQILLFSFKIISLCVILYLIFSEWKTNEIQMNTFLYVTINNLLIIILYIITRNLNISNYIFYFLIHEGIYMLFSLSNYCFLLYVELFLVFIKSKQKIRRKSVKVVKFQMQFSESNIDENISKTSLDENEYSASRSSFNNDDNHKSIKFIK
ncbi:periplasmic binding protein-like II [Neocallimastix californiae]|uniref:Periplasmic binding protein-like II n=1 Tax=Neocallimastix californiae TaxID=1754190 RepID=A0A1Y2BSY2_9FUNG|nr:periplasmic binding protein-like II [Neocallimastix californiae]|eukprot:ORY37851.1 periplasmic binding protein-like II [Neocallimastix californiae]